MNIAVTGTSGRMGRMLVETLYATEGVQLSGA
ncbi:MAG: 4-hydroxy-tetrahydrodipicolinate reductase, partial [Burkholderiales bacterium]